jgi:multiple sugar transport system permease protein
VTSVISKSKSKGRKNSWIAVAFLAPSAIPLLIFVFVPMFGALVVSASSWNLIGEFKFIGIDNYIKLLTSEKTLLVFGNSFYYVAGYLPIVFLIGLLFALALNTKLKGRLAFRAAFFLPVVSSWIAVSIVWRWLLNPSNGVVNNILEYFGIEGPGWWTDPAWAMPAIILASAWKDIGFVTIILLAGLQNINQDYIEAAMLDGANWVKRLFSVVLPMLSPSIFFVFVISMINGIQVFDQVYAMTGGGPGDSTRVVMQQIYDLTFRYGKAGEAAALSWLLFIVIMVVTVVQNFGQKRWVHYGG